MDHNPKKMNYKLEIIRLMSSAYNIVFDILESKFGTSFIYTRKSRGRSMDPRGTPSVTDTHSE
jgi:hypothetical protein